MKAQFRRLVFVFVLFILAPHAIQAQFNTVKYVSYGYFTGLSLADSLMVQDTLVITIDQKIVKILDIDPINKNNDKTFFESRTMSALKYPTADGEYYYVWKLGDRKMVLRYENGKKYLSLYQTNQFGLPNQYLTYLIKE